MPKPRGPLKRGRRIIIRGADEVGEDRNVVRSLCKARACRGSGQHIAPAVTAGAFRRV